MSKLASFSWIKNHRYLVLILIIAALLRFIGTNPGYSPYHSDEPAIYGSAVEMVKKSTLDPGRYDYPATAMLINAFFYKVFFIPINWAWFYITHFGGIVDGVTSINPTKEESWRIFTLYIIGERGINGMFWSRYVTALFGLGNVLLIFLLGRNLFNKRVGLIAAFFLTFNFRHVLNSHITLPDIYNSFFLLLSLLALLNLWKSPSGKNYILAGLTVGLSFSIKYQVQAFLPFALAHLYLSFIKGKLILSRLFNPYVFLAVLLIPAVFVITNPYYIVHFDQAMASNLEDYQKYGFGTKSLNLYPISYIYHIDFGPPLFLASLVGIVLMIKDPSKLLFLFSALAYFFFVFTYYSRGGFYIRNIIPATPLLLIFAAYAVSWLIDFLKNKLDSRLTLIVVVCLLTLLIFIPGKNSVINSYYYSKAWNYDVMARWLKDNLPKESVVGATPFDVPGGPKITKTEFELDGDFSLAEHKEAGDDFALLNLDWGSGSFYFWMNFGSENLSYWNKPVNIMRNTYHGLAAEEMFRYQVYSATKPWQAPDANLILAKIPEWPDVKAQNIESFNFDSDLEGWQVQNKMVEGLPDYQFDQNFGKIRKGSIKFLPGGSASSRVIRSSSPPIKIKENHLYKISGSLKTEKILSPREREGFLRVDFFGDKVPSGEVGMVSSVSSRVHGTDDWVEREVVERAPIGSKYLVVSFQTHITTRATIWLDDVQVKESIDIVEDILAKSPYQYKPIDLNNLYPYSHGNL